LIDSKTDQAFLPGMVIIYTASTQKTAKLFLSELHQISTNFDNF